MVTWHLVHVCMEILLLSYFLSIVYSTSATLVESRFQMKMKLNLIYNFTKTSWTNWIMTNLVSRHKKRCKSYLKWYKKGIVITNILSLTTSTRSLNQIWAIELCSIQCDIIHYHLRIRYESRVLNMEFWFVIHTDDTDQLCISWNHSEVLVWVQWKLQEKVS